MPHAEDAPDQQARSDAWFALPLVFYLPETALSFGVTGGVHLIRPGLKTSSIAPSRLLHTARHQSYGEVMVQLFDSERTVIFGELRAANYPYDFYGLGPLASKDAIEHYTTRYAEVLVAREWVMSGGLRLGPKVHVRGERLVEMEPSGTLAAGGATFADYGAVGLGATLTFDDRDDQFWPTSGTLVEVWALAYGANGGRSFGRGSIDARRFEPLVRGNVLGLDLSFKGTAGDVPFTLMPRLGGARGLRGYYDGRWRDRLVWSTQAEWRFPIAWRFKGTLFSGVAG